MDDSEDDETDTSRCVLPSEQFGFRDQRVEEAETFNNLLTRHLRSEVEDWECNDAGWIFNLQYVTFEVRNGADDPIQVKAESNTMARKFLDPLRVELRCVATDFHELYFHTTEFAILLLQLAEVCVFWSRLWEERKPKSNPAVSVVRKGGFEWRNTAVAPSREGEDAVDSHFALMTDSSLDISSFDGIADRLLGKSIVEICREVVDPERYHGKFDGKSGIAAVRVVHVEPVFRTDLVKRFLDRKRKIHDELLRTPYHALRESVDHRTIPHNSREDTVEGLARALAEASITFHGAPRRVMESIVRYGFIIPGEAIGGTGRALDIRCGASYGCGVYSSPDPYFAMAYSSWQDPPIGANTSSGSDAHNIRGSRIIVCATLMGRAVVVNDGSARRSRTLLAGHSHVSPDQKQYIVLNSAQIIPCYVLHVARNMNSVNLSAAPKIMKPDLIARREQLFGTDEPEEYDSQGNAIRWPGAEQRKKRAMKAAALKYFPYGFGAATGTNFVIEDVADVSDDEEVYGEFQDLRIEQEREIRGNYSRGGSSWLDEYQMVRTTKAEVFF